MGQLGYSSDDGLALSAQARALWGIRNALEMVVWVKQCDQG